jgi:hypothetical protein
VPAASHRRSKAPDLAFADTVVVDDLADAIPLSSDLRFNDETGIERHVASVGFPPPAVLAPTPPPSARPPSATSARGLRGAWMRMRTGVRAQREELTLLWSATAALDTAADPTASAHPQQRPGRMTLGRRLRMLLSFFEWDRADVLRAAWMGLAVFFLVATIGAVILRTGMR